MNKRRIQATFPNGDVLTRTTNNQNLAFGYRVWSEDAAWQEAARAYAGLGGGFSKSHALASREAEGRAKYWRGRGFEVRAEVAAIDP